MEGQILITGHKNPDTDSVCSTIAYAELKRKLGLEAIPVRLGGINRETEFVLRYFDVKVPEMITTVGTQVSDLKMEYVNPASPDISIQSAWVLMKKNNYKIIPVVDEADRLIGVVSISDITARYMDALENNILAASRTPLTNILDVLKAILLCGCQEDFQAAGKVVVAAMTPDEMGPYIEQGDIVLVGNRNDTQMEAIKLGAGCMVLTCGGKADQDVLKLGAVKKCVIMTTPYDTFTAARLINQSVPIGFAMTSGNIIHFNLHDFVDDIKEKMLKTRYRSYPVVDSGGRFKGFISRYHLLSPRRKRVILLDHNEKAQSVHGIEQAEILEIIDHHRLGDLQTGNPIFVRNEPVGSTSTIIANMYFENGIRPSKRMAGILCAAILSDTIKFKSPTCTCLDRSMAGKLAQIAGIQPEEFAESMFKEGLSVRGRSPKQLLYTDFKDYMLGRQKVGIGQVNTMDRNGIDDVRDELHIYMNDACRDKDYDILILMITDIIDEGSEIFFAGGDQGLFERAFGTEPVGGNAYLKGIVSRKKQVVPMLNSFIGH